MPNKKVTKIVTMLPAEEQEELNKPKRKVAAYARVSTLSEEQETSVIAQRDYFSKYIQNREDWDFVDVYYDDGISGTGYRNREGFNRMINDALDGKIDLILTKSLSRFARNTVDTLTTIRKLKDKGVEVYFEKEDIYTLDSKGEFLITLMSSLAQEESRSLSENVTWGIRKRFAEGQYFITGKLLGYDNDKNGNLVINENEAGIVRLIYRLYLYGFSLKDICELLLQQKIPTAFGGKIWSRSTVSGILGNEKYIGDALLQKKYTTDFLTKKRKVNKGEVPQYYIENDHEPIISREVYEQYNLEKQRRESLNGGFSSVSDFSKVLVCSCGAHYGHRVMHAGSKYEADFWRCNAFYGGGSHSPLVREEVLCLACKDAWRRLYSVKENEIREMCCKIVERCVLDKEKQKEAIAFVTSFTGLATNAIDKMFLNSVVSAIMVNKDKSLSFTFLDDKEFVFIEEDIKKVIKPPKEEKRKKRLTEQAKEDIRFYRKNGWGYGKIAETIGYSAPAIKAFCRREGIGGFGEDLQDRCKHCGTPLEHVKGRKKKVFCDDRCRQQYWYYMDKKM